MGFRATISAMAKTRGALQWKLAIVCVFLSTVAASARAQESNRPRRTTAMLSAARPTDSRGETVYELRGRGEPEQPSVAGTFTPPVVLRQHEAFPDYPESMRRKKQDGSVVIEGVVAQDGRFIDLKVFRTSDSGFNENALKAAAKYVFQPAALDGKPVACLLRIEMTFHIR